MSEFIWCTFSLSIFIASLTYFITLTQEVFDGAKSQINKGEKKIRTDRIQSMGFEQRT